jgi:hypothetical protein
MPYTESAGREFHILSALAQGLLAALPASVVSAAYPAEEAEREGFAARIPLTAVDIMAHTPPVEAHMSSHNLGGHSDTPPFLTLRPLHPLRRAASAACHPHIYAGSLNLRHSPVVFSSPFFGFVALLVFFGGMVVLY